MPANLPAKQTLILEGEMTVKASKPCEDTDYEATITFEDGVSEWAVDLSYDDVDALVGFLRGR